MLSNDKVIAVVPVYNRLEETLAFLESMSKVNWPFLEVIVVDDGSSDGTSEVVSARYPSTVVLKGNGSLWWAGATNLGVREALDRSADYILTINNDNLVCPEFLEPLVTVLKDYPRAIVTARMSDVNDSTHICSFGGRIDWHLGEIRDYNSRRDRIDFKTSMDCDWVHGSCTLIPVSAFRELGFFDSVNYPQYHADAEFSLRAKQHGYRLIAEPASHVMHRTSISAGTDSLNEDSFLSVVRNIRSPFFLRANYSLYRKYCPYRPFILFLCIRYLRLFYSLVRRRFFDHTRVR